MRKTSQPKPLPALERLQSLLIYDPDSGHLTALTNNSKRPKGARAGAATKSGYRVVNVDGELYKESRIAWLMGTSEDPGNFLIDHIDGDPSNNALHNLRKADYSQNGLNRKRESKSLSGIRNVRWIPAKKRFLVFVKNPRGKYITKYFKSVEDASRAAEEMRDMQHKDFASKR